MKTFVNAVLLLTLVATTARAQVNAGEQKPEPDLPFTMTQMTTFNLPWRIAFLPDGRMLITEKPGAVWLVTGERALAEAAARYNAGLAAYGTLEAEVLLDADGRLTRMLLARRRWLRGTYDWSLGASRYP